MSEDCDGLSRDPILKDRASLVFWLARERSGVAPEFLARRFPKLRRWELGEWNPTLKQLESVARFTHTPIGYFFLPEPPAEPVPIPDLRTLHGAGLSRPSPDLLDTIYQCQRRQDWFRDHAQGVGLDEVPIVASAATDTDPLVAASMLQDELEFTVEDRAWTWSETLRQLIERTEKAGVLVMVSGVVGSNTHRKLDPEEFRGFALVDPLAPLVFVNGADTKAAQIFTLVHELAHVLLGREGLDDADLGREMTGEVETWCNEVAAEFLVPLAELRERFEPRTELSDELGRLARIFKVSTLVVLRRLYDLGSMDFETFRGVYRSERARVLGIMEERGAGGGDFYNTQRARMSKTFTRAVIASTMEGQTLYRDAFEMLGFKKQSTFTELSRRLGLA